MAIAIAIVPFPHYCRRTPEACTRKNGPHIFEATPARHLPFLYTVHRSSPSESFRSFPAIHTPAPPPPLPPVCLFSFLPVLAFSRRQILKSIEFPVGQTAKLPPNNLPWLVFQRSVESMRNTLRVVVACFIHKNVKCSSNKCLAVFSIYIAFFASKKAHTK